MIINTRDKRAPFIQRDGICNSYLNEIRKYPLLSEIEMIELIKIAQDKDNPKKQMAINKIVNSNQRFVFTAAASYSNNSNLLDLINEGNIGLMTAINRFDLQKNIKFISYAAWWIRKYINSYLTKYSTLVIPANANKLRVVLNKAKQLFVNKNQRSPTLEELQEILRKEFDFNVKNLSDLENIQSISLDETLDNSHDDSDVFSENAEFTKITSSNNINDDIDILDKKIYVSKLIDKLSPNEQVIIRKAFGINCCEESYESIGKEFNLSKEKIHKKTLNIIKKLSKIACAKAV